MQPTVGIVLIGDELLSGKIVDANGPYAVQQLRHAGARVCEITVVADNPPRISELIASFAKRFDIVVTSGGIGPTHDDVTMQSVADAFGEGLQERSELLAMVDRVFGHDPALAAVWRRMASVPESCQLVGGDAATWPMYQVHNVYVLPGVPEIFRRQFQILVDQVHGDPVCLRVYYLSKGEGEIANVLAEAVRLFPDTAFGSYPVLNEASFCTRVTIESTSASEVTAASTWFASQLPPEWVIRVQVDDHRLV